MDRRILAFPLLLMLPSLSMASDEDLRAMVKSLGNQVRQLTHRVTDLESQLAQERQARLQAAPPQAAANPTASNSDAMPPPGGVVPPVAAPAANAGSAKFVGAGSRWSGVQPPATASAAESANNEGKPVSAGVLRGSIKIPGTDTSLAIGGYAKLDAIYNSVSAGNTNFGNQYLLISSIPVGEARLGANSQTTIHAKESRFWLESFTPSSYGNIKAYLEFDFFGSVDSYTPRLRHAYGSMGPFLGGQTWTTFLNVATIPETLDLGSPAGIGIVRQPMIRWTQPFNLNGAPMEFQGALESPNTRLALPGSSAIVSPNDDRYPDLIARLNYNPEWGTLSLAAAGRQIRYAPAIGSALAQWGGAVSLAGKIKTSGPDNIRFALSYGDALGRYATFNTFADAAVDNSGRRMDLANTYSAMLSYQHWWDNNWRSTLAYGFAQSDLPSFANGGLTQQAQSVHANLLWSPVLQATFGLEYIYATRSLESGPYGDLNRVQFSSRFNFH